MPTKHSRAELIRLVESGIREVGNLSTDRFYVIVRNVTVSGSPISSVVASVLVRFLPAGAPFCCGEPACYSNVFRDDGMAELGDYLRRQMNLRQSVSVEIKLDVEYYEGIKFTALDGD